MGTLRLAFWLTAFAFVPLGLAMPQNYVCPITKAPVERFTPPLPWHPMTNSDDTRFDFGTPGLWAFVTNHWKLNREQNKLPYFSEHYLWNWKKPGAPRLAVVARRLDVPAPLVWAERVMGAGPSFVLGEPLDASRRDGAMVTSLAIPSAGCWEISAHFTARDTVAVETLTYIVLVE
jgi:hypothetical protein